MNHPVGSDCENSWPKRPRSKQKRRIFIVAAGLLCLALTLGIANIPPVYDAIYDRFPYFAMHLKPLRRSCENNGIRVEVDAIHLHGPAASVYITIEDTLGDRLDENFVMSIGDYWNTSFAANGSSEVYSYDPQNNTVTILSEVIHDDLKPVFGGRFNYHSDYFLCGLSQFRDDMNLDLSEIAENPPETRTGIEPESFYYSDEKYCDYTPQTFLVPGELYVLSDKVTITAIGYVDGALRVQTHFADAIQAEYNDSFNLAHENGDHYLPVYGIEYPDESNTGFYTERAFDVTWEELKSLRLYCSYFPDEQILTGNWNLSWPLINWPLF